MSSRIKKAKQIVNGKSKFKNAKKLEEDKIKTYVDTIKSFSKTLPDHLKTATCHSNQFEFFLSYHRGLKVVIGTSGSNINRQYFIERISIIEKIDDEESKLLFEVDRLRMLQLIGMNAVANIDTMIEVEIKRREDINKSTAMPSYPNPSVPYGNRYFPAPYRPPIYWGKK